MAGPGYVYLIGRETDDGPWAKVGIAARIGRVQDHRGWTMLVRTFEAECVLADPHCLEQTVLRKFPERGPSSARCAVCGAQKPPVGRNGTDGLTEVRHLPCYPGIAEFFEQEWHRALRLARDTTWQVDFDPLCLSPGGFVSVGSPWRQPPLMDPNEYQANTCNVICIRGVPAAEVMAFLDLEWERGAVNLRGELWKRFGSRVCRADGSVTPRAKGTGVPGERAEVEPMLESMAKLPDVHVVLVTVRKPGLLYAYARPESLAIQTGT